MFLKLPVIKSLQVFLNIGGDRPHILFHTDQACIQILLPHLTEQTQHLPGAVVTDIPDGHHAKNGRNYHGNDDRTYSNN